MLRGVVGIMGFGSMGQALARGLMKSGTKTADKIFVTVKSQQKGIQVAEQLGVTVLPNNEQLLEKCEFIVLGVKPLDMKATLEPLTMQFDVRHRVISLAASFTLENLEKYMPEVDNLVRAIPSLAIQNLNSVTGLVFSDRCTTQDWAFDFFSKLGSIHEVTEGEELDSLMIATASGLGFVFEMMDYWTEWLEGYNFSATEAREIVARTFLGASNMALDSTESPFEELTLRVASKKGVTQAGLESMRELELERILRISFEKALLRSKEVTLLTDKQN